MRSPPERMPNTTLPATRHLQARSGITSRWNRQDFALSQGELARTRLRRERITGVALTPYRHFTTDRGAPTRVKSWRVDESRSISCLTIACWISLQGDSRGRVSDGSSSTRSFPIGLRSWLNPRRSARFRTKRRAGDRSADHGVAPRLQVAFPCVAFARKRAPPRTDFLHPGSPVFA